MVMWLIKYIQLDDLFKATMVYSSHFNDKSTLFYFFFPGVHSQWFIAYYSITH